MTEQHSEPLMARKLGAAMLVSQEDIADAEAMRESQRRWDAMSPERRVEAIRRRDRERAEPLAAAVANWEAVCARLAGNAPAVAALKIHRPEDSGSFVGIACAHCRDGSEGDAVEWECETFTAIKGA